MPERMDISNTKITLYGSKQEIKRAMIYFNKANLRLKLSNNEYSDRLMLMNEFVPHIKCSICYGGNTVWNKERLIRDFKRILKSGMKALTDYLYEFFHLDCGSIAHYDKHRWIATYPSLASLCAFFEKNEYGQSVAEHIPNWKADAIEIVKEVNQLLKQHDIKEVQYSVSNVTISS